MLRLLRPLRIGRVETPSRAAACLYVSQKIEVLYYKRVEPLVIGSKVLQPRVVRCHGRVPFRAESQLQWLNEAHIKPHGYYSLGTVPTVMHYRMTRSTACS